MLRKIAALVLAALLATSCQDGSGSSFGTETGQPIRPRASHANPTDNKGKPCDKAALATGARGCKSGHSKNSSGKPTGKKNKYGEPCTVRDPECN